MAINWTETQIEEVVASVIKTLNKGGAVKAEAETSGSEWSSTHYQGRKLKGVYEDMNDAIDAATIGYKCVRQMSLKERERIITAIRNLCRSEAPTMASLGVAETKMGRVEHKAAKHILVADKTPGTEDIISEVKTGDCGLTLTEMAPFGVVGSITPSTNPSETVICNSIGMIAAGNGVVFNPHPNAISVSNYAVDLVNRASASVGGPEVLVASVVKPTLETAQIMYKHPNIKLLVCTGGPGVVKAVLSSGKKAIGAGAGNPPVIVDDTADIAKAGKDIIDGCCFDNNLPCIAEKEIVAVDSVADELMNYMISENGCYLASKEIQDKLVNTVFTPKGALNRKCVGRSAQALLAMVGVNVGPEIRCIVFEGPKEHPLIEEELMMPILGMVRVKDFEEGVEAAVWLEHGNRHSAHIHSKNVDHITTYAKALDTAILVKNGPSYAALGFGGEGYCTFTIASRTGEGLTAGHSFTKSRRCTMSDSLCIR